MRRKPGLAVANALSKSGVLPKIRGLMNTAGVLHAKRAFESVPGGRQSFYKPWPAQRTPNQLDRRGNMSVTKVRNQGDCGSCWAFASAAAIETVTSVATGMPAEWVSPQGIMDCTPYGGDRQNVTIQTCRGCSGGWPPAAFANAANGTGAFYEKTYYYMGAEGSCRYAVEPLAYPIAGYGIIAPGDEDAIASAVAEHGAVVAIISVMPDLYTWGGKGIYDNAACGSSPDHAVTIVGFDENSWIIKNSWGPSWGSSGYFRLARGKNLCGVANLASFPIAHPWGIH